MLGRKTNESSELPRELVSKLEEVKQDIPLEVLPEEEIKIKEIEEIVEESQPLADNTASVKRAHIKPETGIKPKSRKKG